MNIRNLYQKRYIITLGLMAVFLVLIFVQSTRSSWYGTFVYFTRLANYKILRTGKITGHTITVMLDVKWHRQEHSLSCEIAALKMALSVQGIDIPESELIARLKFDSTPRKNGVWGDPYSGFVGLINGRMGQTGYGVYWEPINLVANSYTRAEVFEATPQNLAQHINEGHAIVSWGYFGRGRKISWQTPDGRVINAINGEHARTIVGFSGDINNPEGFVLLDPIYGEQYWSTQDLFKNWAPFENKGVVVYGQLSI